MIRRADDNPETLRKRLATYHKQTSPLVDFYRKRRLLRTVDASLDSTTIFEHISKMFQDMKSKFNNYFFEIFLRKIILILSIKISAGFKGFKNLGSFKKFS